MKKSILSIIVMFFCLSYSYGQRHLKGMNAVDIGGGITGFGTYVNGDFTHFLNNKYYFKVGGMFESAKFDDVKLNSFLLKGGINRNLFHLGNSFFVQANVNMLVSMNQYKGELIESTHKKKQYFNLGFAPGAEIEYYISDRVVFLLDFMQAFYLGKELNSVSTQVFYAGGGFRLMLQK